MTIPENHQAIMPYLMLKDADKFLSFTTSIFGAELKHKQLRDDKIMHAEVSIDGCTIMFTEATEQWKTATSNLFVYVEDADVSYQKALAEGGTSVMELSDQSYGRTCGVTDPCGNVWWITSV